MKKIVFSTTSIAIYDYKSGHYKKFKNTLTVWMKTKFGGTYKNWEAFIEDEENEVLYIHKGIELKLLGSYFPYHKYEYDNIGTPYKKITNIKLTCKPRDDIQKKSIDFLLSKGEDFSQYADETQRMLCLKPGAGKTYCAINYITQIKLIPIILVDSNKLVEQWKESFINFTNLTEDDIFEISGRSSVEKIMKMKKIPYKVFIAKHQTLQSYCKDDWTLINNIFCKIGIGVKIIDEAHAYWKNIFFIDLYTDIAQTVYLTATPYVSNPYENEVYKKMFSDVVMYGWNLKFDNVYHNIYYVSWNSKPTDIEVYNMSNSHGFDSNRYNDYLLLDENINNYLEMLDEVVTAFKSKFSDTKLAIVVNCNNMVEYLYNHYKNDDVFDEKEYSVGMYCGLIKNKQERSLELEKDIIITTVKSFNKAVDVDNLSVLINTVSISSKTLIDQLTGRLRYNENYKSNYIDITDEGFKQCKNHLKLRSRFLDKISKKSSYIEF